MARPKGTDKTGGRAKGTPNKITSNMKRWIQELIDGNRGQFEKDLKSLDAKDRVVILERLMQYVVPKQQSISVEAQIQAEYEELKNLLDIAPDEVIEKIAERISNLGVLKDE